jgi:hypothetical protein
LERSLIESDGSRLVAAVPSALGKKSVTPRRNIVGYSFVAQDLFCDPRGVGTVAEMVQKFSASYGLSVRIRRFPARQFKCVTKTATP